MRIIGNDPKTPRQTQVVASGTLSTGDTVVVNSDGTVSAVAQINISSGAGTPSAAANINVTAGQYNQITYDAANNKIVAVYSDPDNSDAASAVVGTVSGSSISWGTPVEFASQGRECSCAYDSTNQKIIVVYRNGANFNYGTARVGTVSGTSISFGGATVYNSGDSRNNRIACGNDGRCAIVYTDYGQSNYGKIVVGSISGTSISFGGEGSLNNAATYDLQITYADGYSDPSGDSNVFGVFYRDSGASPIDSGMARVCYLASNGTNNVTIGAETTFNSGATYIQGTASYDTVNQKFVIVYSDGTSSNYPTAIVGTVVYSGIDPTMTFGTEVRIQSVEAYYGCSVYFAASGKHLITYAPSPYTDSYFVEGTISGTSISFGSAVLYLSQHVRADLTYDSSATKAVAFYAASGTAYPTGVTLQLAYTSTNITANNYIGTAQTGAADGNRVVVNIKGAIDENQSGLTAGQSYYVQNDGSLGTTAADPSVFAGTAVSATKLIVKG